MTAPTSTIALKSVMPGQGFIRTQDFQNVIQGVAKKPPARYWRSFLTSTTIGYFQPPSAPWIFAVGEDHGIYLFQEDDPVYVCA